MAQCHQKKLNKIKTKAATAAEKTGRQLWSVGHSACFLSNFEPKKLNRVKQKKRHTTHSSDRKTLLLIINLMYAKINLMDVQRVRYLTEIGMKKYNYICEKFVIGYRFDFDAEKLGRLNGSRMH